MAKKVNKVKTRAASPPQPRGKAPRFASPEASIADDAVAAMLSSYDAKTRAVVKAIHKDVAAIKGVDVGVKWNSVSFRVGDTWFGTVNVRAKEGILLVLHTGAERKSDIKGQVGEMKGAAELKWLGVERAVVGVESASVWKRKWKVLRGVVSEWVMNVQP
ncbi:MAG: hypothetical protein KGS45_02380 [Planctomycetes bacterium]|nr:hypothetical protein [Planctomycetota bacterium]